MSQYDIVIRRGMVVDGTGSAGRVADIGIIGDRIVEVAETLGGSGHRVMDADGLVVTPGFIDPHTHFDGQATWDDRLDPAFGHGVTTAVMGNCGVGFAPVRPGAHTELIDIMEGVEDIPGTALYEGMPWGEWESYPEYLAYLRDRHYSIDLGSQMAHGALRAYVMGIEAAYQKQADADQVEQMAELVRDGMRAGALGLSTNRISGHRGLSGNQVPGTFAEEDELMALAVAMGATGAGVLQAVPGESVGMNPDAGEDPWRNADEIAMLGRISRATGRPVTFSMAQTYEDPGLWRETLKNAEREIADGAQLHPQFAARPPGIICGLNAYHTFQRRETFLRLRELPHDRMVAEMRKPEVKAKILADPDIPDERPGSMENMIPQMLERLTGHFFSIGDPVDYEPLPERTVSAMAATRGETEQSVLYDCLLEADGRNFMLMPFLNYVDGNHDAIYEMFRHPHTVSGLSDAGAHVKLICDASLPTYSLTHWVRDRSRGDRLPLEFVVHKLTARNADLHQMRDRGRIAPGMRADINVIDLAALTLDLPHMRWDLPADAGRLVQLAHGYHATFVAGVQTICNDEDTGTRPGRLLHTVAYAG